MNIDPYEVNYSYVYSRNISSQPNILKTNIQIGSINEDNIDHDRNDAPDAINDERDKDLTAQTLDLYGEGKVYPEPYIPGS